MKYYNYWRFYWLYTLSALYENIATFLNMLSNLRNFPDFSESYRPYYVTIILYDLLLKINHNRMKERPRWDDDGRTIWMLDRGPILQYSPDIDHVFPVLVYSAAQKPHKSLVGHNLLGDGIDEKAGIDEGLAGALARNRAFSEFNKGLAAGGLGTDAALDLTY